VNLNPGPSAVAEDCRPKVCDLLEQHAAALSTMREKVCSDEQYDVRLHDDMWLLRFWLTHRDKGGVGNAVKAALATMHFRAEQGLDEHDIRAEWPDSEHARYGVFFACHEAGAMLHTVPDPDRGVVSLIMPRAFNFNKVIATISAEEQMALSRFYVEWAYQITDEVTRRTGRLTKVTRLVDMAGMKLGGFNREYTKRDAAGAKEVEDFYPQLLERVCLFSSPSWLQGIWRIIRSLFPKRMVDKMAVMPSPVTEAAKQGLLRDISLQNLPAKFGGECTDWPVSSGRDAYIARCCAPA